MINVQERWKEQFRSVYEILWENPRILKRSITSKMGKDAGKILKEASEFEYIIGPQARKRSYQNLREYMYFVNCENPEILYLKYREDQNIVYHAKTIGFCNLWVIAKEKIDIDGDILVEGFRSDYYVSHPPDHSWETAVEIMKKETEIFSPQYASPQNYIQTHFDKKNKMDPKR
jgi:hypothetical protein